MYRFLINLSNEIIDFISSKKSSGVIKSRISNILWLILFIFKTSQKTSKLLFSLLLKRIYVIRVCLSRRQIILYPSHSTDRFEDLVFLPGNILLEKKQQLWTKFLKECQKQEISAIAISKNINNISFGRLLCHSGSRFLPRND